MSALAAPRQSQTCQAIDEHFAIPCGAPATVVASSSEKAGYVCSDCANRAIEHGWTIGPTVEDARDFLAGTDENGAQR